MNRTGLYRCVTMGAATLFSASVAAAADLQPLIENGKRDMEANAVSVRVHGKGNLGAKPRSEAIAEILLSIKERRP